MRVKIEYTNGWSNDIIVTITNERYVAKIRQYLDRFSGSDHKGDGLNWPFDGTIYLKYYDFHFLQNDFGVTEAEYNELSEGYTISKYVDDWIILNCVGYSACDSVRL